MKDRYKIANMLQKNIMDNIHILDMLGYKFKMTHGTFGSEIRRKDDNILIGYVDKTWSIEHEGELNPNNIIFRDKKYSEFSKMLKEENDKLGSK